MQQWVIYGLIASLCFGTNIILFKVASTKGQGLNPFIAMLAYGLGVLILFLVIYLFKSPVFNHNWKGFAYAAIAGAIWAAGMGAIAIAISQKFEVSRLAPIYNTNTLITVLLGIILLREIPDANGILKLIIGSVLIVLGAIFVTI